MSLDGQAEILRNRPRGTTVADGLGDVFASSASETLAVATAYFNAGGYKLLKKQLQGFEKVRFLLGTDPEPPSGRELAIRAGGPAHGLANVRKALEGQQRSMELDRDLLGFSEEQEALLEELVTWLRSGRVEVRRFEERFMHGKAFILPGNESGAIVGSANLTYAGLSRNEELALGVFDGPPVGEATDWFDELWEQAVEFDLAAIYEARFVEHEPWLVWMKFLWERYGAGLIEEGGSSDIRLTRFQEHGARRALEMLRRQNGVMIADDVGLGKTFIAGAILEEYVRNRRQRALVVAPAALRDGPWRSFREKHDLENVKCVSFEELVLDPQTAPGDPGSAKLGIPIGEYSLVIVDEAHNLRNPEALRAKAMRKLLSGRPRKDLVLMTATPVNNRLDDLYELLSLFIKNDARFAPAIPSMRQAFAVAEALDPDDLTPDRLFDIVDATAVRRTRRLVKEHYPDDTVVIDGEEVPLTFPDPKVIKVDDFTLDKALPGIFVQVEHALGCDEDSCLHEGELAARPTLSLARYMPSAFLIKGTGDDDDDRRRVAHETQLAGLLRSGLLKRFESSVHSFALTCRRMARSHKAFLELLESGRVMTGDDLAAWIATDTDDLDVWLAGDGYRGEPASDYDVDALRAAVETDRTILLDFAARAETITAEDDPKLEALVEQLAGVLEGAPEGARSDADEHNRRKVLVFTYYADTARWIFDFLEKACEEDERLAGYRGRLATLSGSQGSKEDVLFGFAPISSEAPPGSDEDRYDLLVTTDVLAEGVNLQQSRNIINYDLPWNPMRLVQRHGRIDRIGSTHDTVDIRCFLDKRLDDYLELEERLHRKLKKAARSIGVGGEILPGSETSDLVFNANRKEIENLEELLRNGGEQGNALSSEEYRQELSKAVNDAPDLKAKLEGLAWGSGTGFVSDRVSPGEGPVFVFMACVGDRSERMMRVVRMGNEVSDDARVDDSTLSAFALARVKRGTERVLSEETHHTAYDAWALARDDLRDKWDLQTDPRELLERIPKVLREAADLVERVTPPGLTKQDGDRVAAALRGVYRANVQKAARAIMGSEISEEDKADELAGVVEEFGLEPEPIPDPLPEIDDEDVHLIAWMAIVPSEAD
jgi:superfamily II DNA or RNA helicase